VQGDKEAAFGLTVSPFCNRENINMPKAQQGFINVFLKVRDVSFCVHDAALDAASMCNKYEAI